MTTLARFTMAAAISILSMSCASVAATRRTGGGTMTSNDPYLWLENVESTESLDWVRAQNVATEATLKADPTYAKMFSDTRAILMAQDRAPFANFGYGYFWNFWQDAQHQQGVFRRTTAEEYRKANPKWDVVLDLDDLSAREHEKWVLLGAERLIKGSSRRLLKLSRGGKDAKVVREFDVETKTFVADGFNLPEAKTTIVGIDFDTVLVATDEGPGSLTTSGYPRILKRWTRGQKFVDAPTVFSAEPADMMVQPFVIKHGSDKYVGVRQAMTFFTARTFLFDRDGRAQRLSIPESAEVVDLRDGRVYFTLREPLKVAERTLPSGSLVRANIDDQSLASAQLIFAPQPHQSVNGISVEKNRVILSLTENVRGKLIQLKVEADHVRAQAINLPELGLGMMNYTAADEDDPSSFAQLMYSDHLRPPTSYRISETKGQFKLGMLKQEPRRFDPTALEVIQNWAVSHDGTKVPYFLMKRKDTKLDGTNPTVLYGYGGFEVSLTPDYNPLIGKLWLERGGVYVIANIRGGGEFGPEWHRAALKHDRQKAFDDFIAVAEDLHARKITSPRHLGIKGGSNGGLLTGTVMVQRPDLMNAALIMVPLLDMVRYTELPAGASWIGEYGDPKIPADLESILKYSPYQNLKPDAKYPRAMLTTSTKDDRVHPGHARKMVARMIEQKHPVLYFENINGGHTGSANPDEAAHLQALGWTYLWERLR